MEPILTINNLTKRFGSFTAVDSISFEVDKGEIFGFLGANGAGKTTAMRMLCGLLTPSAGDIEVLGCRIPEDAESLRRKVGALLGEHWDEEE